MLGYAAFALPDADGLDLETQKAAHRAAVEPRPEVKLAAMNGRLVDLETTIADLVAEVAELRKRLDEADRRWELVKAFGNVTRVQESG